MIWNLFFAFQLYIYYTKAVHVRGVVSLVKSKKCGVVWLKLNGSWIKRAEICVPSQRKKNINWWWFMHKAQVNMNVSSYYYIWQWRFPLSHRANKQGFNKCRRPTRHVGYFAQRSRLKFFSLNWKLEIKY